MSKACGGFLFALGLSVCGPACAELQGRDLDGNRPGFEAYYDTRQDITWMADGNHAKTSGYHATGLMSFAEAATWAENLSYYGTTGWRLAANLSPDPVNCEQGYAGAVCGYNAWPNASEIVSLFQRDWGLSSVYASTGAANTTNTFLGRASPMPDGDGDGVQVRGLAAGVSFDHVQASYWSAALASTAMPCPAGADCSITPIPGAVPIGPASGYWRAEGSSTYLRCLRLELCIGAVADPVIADTEAMSLGHFGPARLVYPWVFEMAPGRLQVAAAGATHFALAVHPGDVALVPESGTASLMLLGLVVTGLTVRRVR